MIGWVEIYKVIVAITPLYVALVLGYGSVKWWKIFTPEQCEALNSFVYYFLLPLFTFEFTAHVDALNLNYRFIAGDVVSKVIIVVVVGLWAKYSTRGSFPWSITSFSLCSLTNSLVVGVPLVKTMYGQKGVDLVVQGSVVQAIVWLSLLLLVLEFRRARLDDVEPCNGEKDLEENSENNNVSRGGFWGIFKLSCVKLALNPNYSACLFGISWAFIASRWHVEMPSILEGSISIMSKAGTGTAMFSIGIFAALQEKMLACGAKQTMTGLILRFIAGPIAMALGSTIVGLRGDSLQVAILQAALPQSITSFVYAKEYGLHAPVLSTAVILGMMVSLPVLIAYYAVLEFIPK